MGYNTDFEGELKFTKILTPDQTAVVETALNELRDDQQTYNNTRLYIALEMTDAKDGIQWTGDEKTYDMDTAVMMVLETLNRVVPGLSLHGRLLAQGEEIRDRWYLDVSQGIVSIKEIKLDNVIQECPSCGHEFIVE